VRQDLTLTNSSGMAIHCSHYFPASRKNGEAEGPSPTVVYLHGNSGCRLEGDAIADRYLRRGMAFFCVDFGGCGNSDGGLVTLGFREREDVEVVLDYLHSHAAVSYVCLYGRSMGAATALLVAADDRYYHTIAGLVIDSCYVSVREVALDVARKYAGHFPLIPTESSASIAVDALREAVVEKAGFDIDSINVLRAAPLCQTPALFGHASEDTLVSMSHADRVFEAYGCMYDGVPKDICIFPGDHNSSRSDEWTDRTCEFLEACFHKAEREGVNNGLARRLMLGVLKCVPSGSFRGSHCDSKFVKGDSSLRTRRHSEPSRGLKLSVLNPSSRAKPAPAGDADYQGWLMQQEARGRPGTHARSVNWLDGLAATPPTPNSPLSPVGDFLGAVFGAKGVHEAAASQPMTPRLPPRHEAHANVYKSPAPAPLRARFVSSAVTHVERGAGCNCTYCGISAQPLHVQLPGPWHRPDCRRWEATAPELHSPVVLQPTRRADRRSAPAASGPPRGPADCVSSEGSSAGNDSVCWEENVDFIVSSRKSESAGQLGVWGMLLLVLFVSLVTYKNQPELDGWYRYT
jgi:dienelactone hydrolase